MIIGLQGSETVVSRLRLNVATSDPALASRRLASLLHNAHLHPAGLAPAAIVFIHRLYDPLPGALRLDQSGGHLPAAWDRAARELLDRQVSGAARPALGAVSPSDNAVVFLDRSELLACLASDWCEGSVVTRWWWQSLLRQGAASQVVKELWRRAPEYVPAALQQLANKNKAVDFVRALSDDEARQLLRGVARSFALQSLIPVLDVFASPTSAQRESVDINELKTARQRETDEQLKTRPDAPWRPWVPESAAAALRPEQELFLGIALMLQRAPVKVRAAGFQTQVRHWQQEIALARERNSVSMSNARDTPPATDRQPRGAVAVAERLLPSNQPQFFTSPSDASQVGEETASPLKDEVASPPSVSAKMQSATTTETDRPAIDSLEPTKSGSQQSSQSPQTTVAHVEAAPPASDERLFSTGEEAAPQTLEAVTADYEETEEWIETQLGGLFYLINLGLFLGLYGDFTTPDEPGLQLNIWDFVALLGRELVGEDIQDDPVWPLLARLAKREEDDPPGSGFDPDDEWRMPSFEFRVPSFELSKDSALEKELETRDSKPETRNLKLETSSAIAAWLDRLLPYVRARLRKALGLTEEEDPGLIICRHRARVCVTPTHVDLFFSLAELPIEIRLAGLDRNPGWVPAAGRFITFHFE